MTNSSALSSAHSSKASNRGCCIPVFSSPCSKTRSGEVRHFSSTGNFPHVECILTSTPSTADSPLLAVETATDPAANTAAPARIFFEGMFNGNAGDFRGICFFVEAGMNASLFPLATVLSNDVGEAQDCPSVISVKLALCGSCRTPFACAALLGHTAEAAKIPAARALPVDHFPILLPESFSILRHTVPLPVTMSASCRHSGMQRKGIAEFSFEPGVMSLALCGGTSVHLARIEATCLLVKSAKPRLAGSVSAGAANPDDVGTNASPKAISTQPMMAPSPTFMVLDKIDDDELYVYVYTNHRFIIRANNIFSVHQFLNIAVVVRPYARLSQD